MFLIEGMNGNNKNIILKRLYICGVSKFYPKFKYNDSIRVAQYCKTFDKMYIPNWTEEYYRVSKIENTLPQT